MTRKMIETPWADDTCALPLDGRDHFILLCYNTQQQITDQTPVVLRVGAT